MIEKNRDEIIIDIYDEYYAMYLDYKKIAVVTVTSAVALDEQTTNRIVNILKHKIKIIFVLILAFSGAIATAIGPKESIATLLPVRVSRCIL